MAFVNKGRFGQSEYGLYNTVASTISMLSILNLGFSSSYIKYFAIYKRDNNKEAINKLNGLFLIIFVIIGAVALLCGLYFTTNLNIVFKDGLTQNELKIAKILMLLLSINLAISFPMSVFISIISANERFIFLKLLGMLKTILGPLLTIPLLLMGKGSVAMVTVTLVVSLIVDAINIFYVLKILENHFEFKNFEKGIFRSLFTYTAFIAINIFIDQINWNIDKILLGRYKGTVAVAIYSVGATLQTYYQMFSTAISGIFTPRIHNIINSDKSYTEKQKETSTLFIKVGRIQFLILGLVCTELIIFGKEFVYYWAGAEYIEAYVVALLLVLPVTIPLIQNLGVEIQRALNRHQFRSMVYALMAVVNLIISIILCKRYGAIGAAIGTTISLVIANGVIMNIYYQKKCGINIINFWKNIFQMSIGIIPPFIIGVISRMLIDYKKIGCLGMGIGIYAVLYVVSMWLLGINETEKRLIKEPLLKCQSWINDRKR